MLLNEQTILKIGKLSRIGLEKEKIPALQKEMEHILNWVALLEEVDITGVKPMIGPGHAHSPMRKDEVTDGNCPEEVLANAPERIGNFFTVPKVVE